MEADKPDTNDQESSNLETGTDDSKDSNNDESVDQTTTFEHVNAETDDIEDEHAGISKDPFELTQEERTLEADLNKDADDLFTQNENSKDKDVTQKESGEDDSDQNQEEKHDDEDLETPTTSGELFDITFQIEEATYIVNIQNAEVTQPCKFCDKLNVVKYNYMQNTEKKYICSDQCLRRFKVEHKNVVVKEPFKKFFTPPLVSPMFKFTRLCRQCAATLNNSVGVISWEAMDFCKEPCLYRYQMSISKACAECGNPVAYTQLGKYAVRFGCIVRQFCSGTCLEAKKKKIRICSYCQKSIQRTKTSIGNKYFCNETCKGMYENLQMPKRPPYLSDPANTVCFVCKSNNEIRCEFSYHCKSYFFCSAQCYTVFKFVQCCDFSPKKCHTCSKYVLQQYLEKHALYYDNLIHYFCSDTCQHIYVITNRRVVPCLWCKVKKYNFDMIQKSNYLESTIYTCSISCLNQLKATVKAAISTGSKCHNCSEPGNYELHLGGGAMATFCSNNCISTYQTQRLKAQVKRTRSRVKQIIPDKPGPLPVIANVCSLATNPNKNVSTEPTIRKIIIIKEEESPEMKNVATAVGTDKCTVSTEVDIIDQKSVECQADIDKEMSVIPIMVPIYVPAPFHVWSAPVPKPVPFPLVIPCPILIPTTKKTSENILKEVKKEAIKTPDDPFEAELLMMAELVAAEKKDEVEEPKSEEETIQTEEDDPPEEENTEFGEDMLQMALNMATNFTEPPVDLEGALQASTITPSHANETTQESENISEPRRPSTRGRRKTRTQARRGRRPAQTPAPEPEPEPEPIPQEPVEKPDAHMCLKYTFGVNAWKQWVIMKNAELERSSRKLKLFKPELLQLTSDELNYSLCLFVQEVRKPNGSEYAPDTIYYLCLGIQQYLYENGRIDNIFCDSYYEKFTECLNDVCKKFTALYNDSHYIVTRVEEEHLWESKQLGAHSPHVLLSTLMFFNTKYFNLTNVEEHMQLSFSHIMKHWKRINQPGAPKVPGSRNVLLRFYPPQSTLDGNARKKRVYEQEENEENPLRCPVKLYEFYLSKCPESIKTRNDVFYLQPERSCVPDSPVWYSTMAMERVDLEKMLHRVKMVKEINVALLTN